MKKYKNISEEELIIYLINGEISFTSEWFLNILVLDSWLDKTGNVEFKRYEEQWVDELIGFWLLVVQNGTMQTPALIIDVFNIFQQPNQWWK